MLSFVFFVVEVYIVIIIQYLTEVGALFWFGQYFNAVMSGVPWKAILEHLLILIVIIIIFYGGNGFILRCLPEFPIFFLFRCLFFAVSFSKWIKAWNFNGKPAAKPVQPWDCWYSAVFDKLKFIVLLSLPDTVFWCLVPGHDHLKRVGQQLLIISWMAWMVIQLEIFVQLIILSSNSFVHWPLASCRWFIPERNNFTGVCAACVYM